MNMNISKVCNIYYENGILWQQNGAFLFLTYLHLETCKQVPVFNFWRYVLVYLSIVELIL